MGNDQNFLPSSKIKSKNLPRISRKKVLRDKSEPENSFNTHLSQNKNNNKNL